MKRGAIDLSVNLLVIIIISLVIFGLGVTFLYQLLAGAVETQNTLDEKTNAELTRLLISEGKIVTLPFQTATIARGEQHVFGLGIANIAAEQSEFRIDVTFAKLADAQENDLSAQVDPMSVEKWLFYNTQLLKVRPEEPVKEGILVAVPKDALPGQYTFKVRVFTGEKQYGNTQTFYVMVK